MSKFFSFDSVGTAYNGPQLERDVLEFWKNEDVFKRICQQQQNAPLYSFYDGPPTANGRPGIHHVLARTFKDIFPRYKTMRGYNALRKAGWDTHGLPVEHEIEKQLGIFDKQRIEEEVGIAEFTRLCRESVMRYIAEWKSMTERMGFWADLEDPYSTMDNAYIESVWHLLKTIWDKGLIARDYKVVPYDPRIGATLSSHEVALGYKEVEDPSIYVRFPLQDESASLLAWTTTPWTLPANLALAVDPTANYSWVKYQDEVLIVAEALISSIFKDTPELTPLKTEAGSSLLGRRYRRPFDWLEGSADCWQVLAGEFVNLDDGTGIVHQAPAYGADDLELCRAYGLPVVHAVGLDGRFLPNIEPVKGLFFKDGDPILINILKERGLLFRAEQRKHNYPFGWRTGDPIIYYAKHAWYIRTSTIKDRLLSLNKSINWVPQGIRDGRFGRWLENNVDWALSRERFWGTPLPVWTDGDDNFMCIGSIKELETLSGRDLSAVDMHRPSIDAVEFKHPQTGKVMRRCKEVIDCWFDSGAMPYAQFHYPFENKEIFEQSFPADFICEAIDQTRGWFYTLHAIAALVSDSVAYKNVICLSHIVDKNGSKMSKSQGNVIEPDAIFNATGVDALRWYFTSRVAVEAQKRVSIETVQSVVNSFINTWWNVYSFFITYANLEEIDFTQTVASKDRTELDRWILALLQQTINTVEHHLDHYQTKSAGEAIELFVDRLSNWYIRRNRRRFWKSDHNADTLAAYLTLYECLRSINRLMAPFMPFIAENIHKNLERKNNPQAAFSVHAEPWPTADSTLIDTTLIERWQSIIQIVNLGRSARAKANCRTRQPLRKMLVRIPPEISQQSISGEQAEILDELNIKEIEFIQSEEQWLSYRIRLNLPKVGKRLGKNIPHLQKMFANSNPANLREWAAESLDGQTITVDFEEQTFNFMPEDLLVDTISAEGYSCADEAGHFVALDYRLDESLIKEGLLRELIRSVQVARKNAGLEVHHRIALYVDGSPKINAVITEQQQHIMDEVLATKWNTQLENDTQAFSATGQVDDQSWNLSLKRISN